MFQGVNYVISKRYTLEIESVRIERPELQASEVGRTRKIYPQECRARKLDYNATIEITCMYSIRVGANSHILNSGGNGRTSKD